MSVSNVGVIDTFLNTFTTYIDSGFGLIKGEVTYLSSTLIVIDITLAGLFWAWGADEDVIQRLVKKTLYIGFFAFIIGNFNGLAKIIFNSFAGLGLEAGGSQITLDKFLQPGNIASTGLTVGQGLLDQAAKLSGPVAFFTNLIQILVLIVAALVVLVAFFILAVQLFITLIEFKLTTLAGFVLVPFALFNKTAFLAEKVLGNVVASGIKVMVLAVIVGIGTGLFSQFTTSYGSTQPTTEQALSTALAALALLGLGIFGPGIATGLVSGAPQLGAGAAVGTGLAVAGTAMLGGAALGAAGRGAVAAASSAGAAARGGASLAGATSAAYTLGANGRSGMAGVASGMGGVGRTAGGAAVRTAAAPFKRAADAMKESFQAGARSVSGAGEGGSVAGSTGGGDGSTGDPPAAGAPGGGPDTPGGPGDGPSSGSAPTGKADSKPPAWARRMKRSQAMSHGASAAANAVKSGDSHGGGHSVDLSEKDS